jgi:hypothetical protein
MPNETIVPCCNTAPVDEQNSTNVAPNFLYLNNQSNAGFEFDISPK